MNRDKLAEKAVEFYNRWMQDPTNERCTWGTKQVLADFALELLAERDAEMKRLISTLESVEYELSHGDLIAGDVTRFSVKDGLLKQVREALGK